MLELRSLRYLFALSRRLSYARAAEDLGISQSALSRSIQSLERQLGMRLFDRDRAGVTLTPQGRLVVDRAAVLLADADDLERQFLLSAQAQAGRIRFGMVPLLTRALLSGALSERIMAAPDVTNEVVVRDVEALWALLVAGEIEFFVSQEGQVPDSPPARVETLGHFPLNLIVRAGHPLLTGERPGERFPVVRSSWTGLPLPAEILDRVRGAPNVIEDFGSLAAITASTDAIWFSSTYSATEELRAGQLCVLPRPSHVAPLEVRMVVYTLERRSQSPLARLITQALRRQIKVLAQAEHSAAQP